MLGEPGWLLALMALPPIALLLLWAQRRRQAALDLLLRPALQAALPQRPSARLAQLRMALLLGAVGLCLLALCRPQWGNTWQQVQQEGVDLIVAVDVSDSMLVEDVQSHGKLSRLEQAKRDILDLLHTLHGDRVGLVAFAGAAYVECPLTLDYNAVAMFLDDIDPNLISTKGTALGSGIRTALSAMGGAEHASQAILLITDGEDHGAEAIAAAPEAATQHVPIFPIGIGRPEGAPVPLPEGGLHRDAQGNVILSKLDAATLQQIAQLTGGLYTHSMAGELDLERVYVQGIRGKLQAKAHHGERRQRGQERFMFFLAAAWLLLAAEAWLGERPAGTRPQPQAPRGEWP